VSASGGPAGELDAMAHQIAQHAANEQLQRNLSRKDFVPLSEAMGYIPDEFL
jgi:hypothetical protein